MLVAARPALASLLAFLLVVLAVNTTYSFTNAAGLIVLLLLLVLIWAVAMASAVAVMAWRSRSRRSAFLALALLVAWPAAQLSVRMGDVVHLLIMLPSYMRQDDLKAGKHFDWGLRSFIVTASLRTLVYVPDGDAVLMAPIDRCASMKTVRHLLGSFYLMDEPLPCTS